MNVLHIANLSNNKSEGPNINVPKNIIYGNKFANTGLYNLNAGKELAISVPKDRLFNIADYPSMDSLPSPFNDPDIVIFQGLYFIKYCKIAKGLRQKNTPYIIVPRCSMTTAAIKSHYLKKKTANIFFFNKFVSNAKKIQFLTENEYLESKENFKFKKHFILGNGTEVPSKHYSLKTRREFKITFIGRYDVYHKGLDILLEAVKKHSGWFRSHSAILELHGSDSDNGLGYLTKFLEEHHLKDIIHIEGPVFDGEKEEVLLDTDVFIHTSRLEGQPTSVIEAISYGIPVIVTPGTNVADLVKNHQLGFTTELTSESVFNCIKKAFSSKEQFDFISSNEKAYAEKNFEWDSIIKQSLKEYTE